jgi:hypothetical protein
VLGSTWSKTSIRWVKRTNEKDYVVFRRESGCWAHLGRVGGKQVIVLGDACSKGCTIHEMLHALGAWHEQSRSDRDKYVKINWANIQSGYKFAFETYIEQGYKGVDINGYDFQSIMHYSSMAFSKNGKPTIVRKSDGSTISAQRNSLSKGDIAGIKKLYAAPAPTACTSAPVAGAGLRRAARGVH